jgi:hypothetical protein
MVAPELSFNGGVSWAILWFSSFINSSILNRLFIFISFDGNGDVYSELI